MLEKALELLKIFEEHGYEAYLVGGFVRDFLLNRKSNDVDICTNATPMDVKEIFKDVKLPFEGYGSVHLTYKKVNFEITTYRMDLEYKNGRSPSKIMYTDSLFIDLKRRDFTINTLCMDSKQNIIDLLGSMVDLKHKVIKTVGNADLKLKEDSLRILRAIRFATELKFNISEDLKKSIDNNKQLLSNLSFFRKKQELNKIFSSPNASYGISLIKCFKIDKYLGINLDRNIINTNDPLGIWVQVEPCDKYQFTNNEKQYMKAILDILKDKNISNMELYKKGNYVCYIAAQILGINAVEIYDRYDKLPIKNKSDIALKTIDIINYLNLKDKSKVKLIINDLEEKIINNEINNDELEIKKYLIDTYENNML